MLAHGFTREMMDEIIRTGLATTSVERMVAGGKSIEVVRVEDHGGGSAGVGHQWLRLMYGIR